MGEILRILQNMVRNEIEETAAIVKIGLVFHFLSFVQRNCFLINLVQPCRFQLEFLLWIENLKIKWPLLFPNRGENSRAVCKKNNSFCWNDKIIILIEARFCFRVNNYTEKLPGAIKRIFDFWKSKNFQQSCSSRLVRRSLNRA